MTAADVIAKSSEEKLCEIFTQLGEERYAKQIAHAIVLTRRKRLYSTTRQLAALVREDCTPPITRKTHPATKVFQALRIYVNRELENISAFLAGGIASAQASRQIGLYKFSFPRRSLGERVF